MGVKKVRTAEGFLRSGLKTNKGVPWKYKQVPIWFGILVWSFWNGKKCSAFTPSFGIVQCWKFYNVGPTYLPSYLPFKTPLMSDFNETCAFENLNFMTIFVMWRWAAFAILPGAVFRQHFKFCSRQSSVNTKNPRIESFSWMFQSAHNLKLHLDRAGKVLRRPLAGLGWVTMAAAASYFGTSH